MTHLIHKQWHDQHGEFIDRAMATQGDAERYLRKIGATYEDETALWHTPDAVYWIWEVRYDDQR